MIHLGHHKVKKIVLDHSYSILDYSLKARLEQFHYRHAGEELREKSAHDCSHMLYVGIIRFLRIFAEFLTKKFTLVYLHICTYIFDYLYFKKLQYFLISFAYMYKKNHNYSCCKTLIQNKSFFLFVKTSILNLLFFPCLITFSEIVLVIKNFVNNISILLFHRHFCIAI